MIRLFFISLLCLAHSSLLSQDASTEIYLVDISISPKGLKCGTPRNITNHAGYDNQPEFSKDGKKILYVSMPDTLQTDIFEYTLSDSSTRQLTKTPESEYSPVIMPTGHRVSFVRVDADKGQRLYAADDSFSEVVDLASGLDSIGYYRWLSDTTLALVCLNNGLELYIYEVNTGQYVVLEKGIGRCLLKIPGSGDVAFTRKSGDTVALFVYYQGDEAAVPYLDGLNDVQDYVFTPDGSLLAGLNGKLFAFHPDNDKSWREVADFTKSVGSFYRMAVSPDGKHLAMVSYKGKRP